MLGPYVQPLPWQREDRDVAAGTLCDVAGWGVVNHAGRRPDRLQHLLLPVLDRATCNLRKYHDGTITKSMMCAESRRRDSCKVQGRGWASRGVGAKASGGRGGEVGGGAPPACWGRSQQKGRARGNTEGEADGKGGSRAGELAECPPPQESGRGLRQVWGLRWEGQ